jgi:hypothetical protein
MKQSIRWVVLTMVTMLLGTACRDATESDSLAGAWRSQIRFSGGTLAEWKNLEFMYVFNAGGTMTESSNYDASPPGPPAYGAWRRTGPRQFEARYLFFATQPPRRWAGCPPGTGFSPRESSCPTTGRASSRRSATRASIRPESPWKAPAKARASAPGSDFDARREGSLDWLDGGVSSTGPDRNHES